MQIALGDWATGRLGDWAPGTGLVVAANAQVRGKHKHRWVTRDAWGDGMRFRKGDRATYFNYTVTGDALLCGGSSSKCVFFTSTTHTGNLGGLSGADAICQSRAEAVGSLAAPGTYKAWLADATGSPTTTFTLPQTLPYVRTEGVTVAGGFPPGDQLIAAIVDEFGVSASLGSLVWTNTSPAGVVTGSGSFGSCQAWSGESDSGAVGQAGQVTSLWTSVGGRSCAEELHLYCFEQ